MHRGRGAAGFPATGAWDSVGASTRGLHRTWFVFVGHRNKASDSGSPFVEFPRSGRKVEEQLRARQGLCWRRWQRNLHGSRRASTSDHVRRSSITTPRSHAVFTSASASGRVFYVPGVVLGALPATTPRIFGVITPFIARCLGGARCWRRRGSLGGPCVAFGRGGDDLGRPRSTREGLGSAFGFGDVWPVTRRTNIAASQTPAAGMVLVFASSTSGPFCDRSAARLRRDGLSGFRLANRHRRLLLGRHDDEEAPN